MIRTCRSLFLIAVAAGTLTACAAIPGPTPTQPAPANPTSQPSPSVSTQENVRDGIGWIAFQRPAAWKRWQPNGHDPINDGPLIYLSTESLLPTCAKLPGATPNPPDSRGAACDAPLSSLSANAVLVTWSTTRILQRLPTTGEPIAMNGSSARLRIERPGSCAAIRGDETIAVLVPIGQPTPLSNIAVVACLRGPDVATSEAQVRAMFTSATVAP